MDWPTPPGTETVTTLGSCSAASRSTGTSRGGDFFAASALSRRFRALLRLFLPALRVPPYARSQKINQRQRLAHAASSSSATVAVPGKLKLIRGSARAIGNGAHRRSSNLRAALGPSLRRRSNGHRFQTDERTAGNAPLEEKFRGSAIDAKMQVPSPVFSGLLFLFRRTFGRCRFAR